MQSDETIWVEGSKFKPDPLIGSSALHLDKSQCRTTIDVLNAAIWFAILMTTGLFDFPFGDREYHV
jgi:hypothetical protein